MPEVALKQTSLYPHLVVEPDVPEDEDPNLSMVFDIETVYTDTYQAAYRELLLAERNLLERIRTELEVIGNSNPAARDAAGRNKRVRAIQLLTRLKHLKGMNI